MTTPGKRELNKAQTRQDILRAVYKLTKKTNFRNLKVKAITDEIKITEMTFFNYFKKKEDILRYMMGLWALDLMVLQHKHPLTGKEAIRRIFQRTAEQVKKHPGLLVSFISYLVTAEIDPTADDIEIADRFLLYPELSELFETRIVSGNEMLIQHLNEINPSVDHSNNLHHLASCFYGDVLVAHTANLDIELLYTESLNLILDNL